MLFKIPKIFRRNIFVAVAENERKISRTHMTGPKGLLITITLICII